ncbi:MAG: hypothetical protein WBG92_10525 [Thiohalocapsa sp.]
MWVVKLGGSLDAARALRVWVNALADSLTPLIICPGGGGFADAVRDAQSRWAFDDRTAHRMAILGMEQTAHLLCGLRPDLAPVSDSSRFDISPEGRRQAVWFPSAELLNDAGLPHSWNVTSDSLAAILARRIGAEGLALVKSSTVPDAPLHARHCSDLLDSAFHCYGSACGCPVWLLSGTEPDGFERLVRRGDAACQICFD